MQFRVRQYEKTDFETLWRIDQACFDGQLAYSQAELDFYMRRPGSFTMVAEIDRSSDAAEDAANGEDSVSDNGADGSHGIIGFIVAEARRRSGHIITIDVVATARRAGVGSALLQVAEARILQAGANIVVLETPVNNEAAIRFYKRMGFFVEKTVAGYYSNHMDALVMSKELARASVG